MTSLQVSTNPLPCLQFSLLLVDLAVL
uniref:Uncharacterized protein n=1 Tax=Anguilla anguilla TaxID=7936 RepID=A0A0E9PJC8_ANGAN